MPGAHPFVNAATLWEIAIKHALGKGDMPATGRRCAAGFPDAGQAFLTIKPEHAVRAPALPSIHHDRFDRLWVAQAQVEPITLMPNRPRLVGQYGTSIMLA